MSDERPTQEPVPEQHPATADRPADEAAPPQPAPADGPVESRGIGWIIAPALLGILVGAGLEAMSASIRPLPRTGAGTTLLHKALSGGLVGGIAGGVFGLLVWILFPYKGRNPHAYRPDPDEKEPDGGAV